LDLGDNEEVAKGEVAILSKVDMLENMFRASGKFGGVAGVFAGVISENPAVLLLGMTAS
jgi:hypothetical protein